ncbi:uncharacterized protein FIBRA_01408 [Fibroporia radiculosa]|uniref:Uncharacterized protein n=1 Tax=Fibroporia radiculosa TaxID=599839 RepID=J4GK51_9APHY|nr:uncharacterized protein FIBRA_01408 [Fibroporia radiculosa]CCL99390.1 predicted protein [Fibroporia radiculosa]
MAPRTSGTKIIIKPRRARAGPSRIVEPPPEEEEVVITDVEDQDEVEESADEASTITQTPRPEEEEGTDAGSPENEDADSNDGGSVEGDEDVEEGGTPARRVRGRGRGRGRGSASGTSTPRGRGRGRGRPKMRGRGTITIKLPRRTGEEGPHEELEPVIEEAPPEASEEGPTGGGKPFRRIQGKVYILENDEYVTDDDPKGDAKIDSQGNLLGGRKFKAQTFAIPNRHPERKYMLAIDAARTSGFRDSLYYFRRNPLAMKLIATQAEKEYLIEAGKLGSHLRTRSVTLITARSAYKLHGSKMILDGKWVVDDYFEDKATEEAASKGLKPGDPVGEFQETSALAAEAAALGPGASMQANKADRGGSGLGMYRAGGPTTIFGGSGWGPYSDGPLNAVRKSMLNRDGLNEENWMLIAAQRTVDASAEWAQLRGKALKVCGGILDDAKAASGVERGETDEARGTKRSTEEGVLEKGKRRRTLNHGGELPLGIYEPHSGIVLYRSDTQPTRARWETVPDDQNRRQVIGGAKVGGGAWALAWIDSVMELSTEEDIDPHAMARATTLQQLELGTGS